MVRGYFSNVYQGKKVLVTGHTGFKGSWLAIWLKTLGAEIYGYALPPSAQQDNFVRCALQEEIYYHEADIRDAAALNQYLSAIQPDIAFHLAAQPLVIWGYKEPRMTYETNVMGVVNFFEAVRNTPSIKVAINVTSDKCYADKEQIYGYREEDPMGGKDPYSASKGCAELITNAYFHAYFKDSVCAIASARAGNVLGGGDWSAGRIVPDYFRSIKEGKKLIIRHPDATRPWQHVLEPLSGYLQLGAMLWVYGKKYSGAWNFGPGGFFHYSVQELVNAIVALDAQSTYTIAEVKDDALHEATFLQLDISKAVHHLHWQPVLNFEETVAFTVQGYHADLATTGTLLHRRVAQVQAYARKARQQGIVWAG